MTVTIMGTRLTEHRVFEIARELGFDIGDSIDEAITRHRLPVYQADHRICLQIHPPAIFGGVDGIQTEIEFQEQGIETGYNPNALYVLRRLYRSIPDLKYRRSYGGYVPPTPINPLSALLGQM